MKKNGFVLVETIVAIVVLTSSLLFLYTTFFNILQAEKKRVYYDDINYLYRANYIKKELYDENFKLYLKQLKDKKLLTIEGSNITGTTIPLEGGSVLPLIKTGDSDFFRNLFAAFEVNSIYIMPRDTTFDKLKKCDNKCAFGTGNCNGDSKLSEACQLLFSTSDGDLVTYLKSVDVSSTDSDYIMVVEFNSCDKNKNCRNYYSWVGVKDV